MTVNIQIVLFRGFDPLDVVAPFEVFSAAREVFGADLSVCLVSDEEAHMVVSGTPGLPLIPTGRLVPGLPGYIVVPGACGPLEGDPDAGDETIPVLLARFGASSTATQIGVAFEDPAVTVATVCGGSLALAMAGLLEGRVAVTHHLGMDVLDATGVQTVQARVVDDGNLISSGGVTSGLDLALYVLNREFGPDLALDVEALFEYETRGTVWRRARPEARLATASVTRGAC